MEKKSRASKRFFYMFLILFITFLCLYSISINGYNERKYMSKTLYTEDEIREFESNIKSGNMIGYDDTHIIKEKDYSNKMSKIGEKVSDYIYYLSNKAILFLNEVVDSLFM